MHPLAEAFLDRLLSGPRLEDTGRSLTQSFQFLTFGHHVVSVLGECSVNRLSVEAHRIRLIDQRNERHAFTVGDGEVG